MKHERRDFEDEQTRLSHPVQTTAQRPPGVAGNDVRNTGLLENGPDHVRDGCFAVSPCNGRDPGPRSLGFKQRKPQSDLGENGDTPAFGGGEHRVMRPDAWTRHDTVEVLVQNLRASPQPPLDTELENEVSQVLRV